MNNTLVITLYDFEKQWKEQKFRQNLKRWAGAKNTVFILYFHVLNLRYSEKATKIWRYLLIYIIQTLSKIAQLFVPLILRKPELYKIMAIMLLRPTLNQMLFSNFSGAVTALAVGNLGVQLNLFQPGGGEIIPNTLLLAHPDLKTLRHFWILYDYNPPDA